MKKLNLAIALVSFTTTPVLANTLFLEDNFDSENGGSSQLDYVGFENWNVSSGSVDLAFAGNSWGISCSGSSGGCVDLAGATNSTGRLESEAFDLGRGTYQLSFDISGNQRGGSADTVQVSLGTLYSETFTKVDTDPFATIIRTISVSTSTSASLVFDHTGGVDWSGPILDNVKLEAVASSLQWKIQEIYSNDDGSIQFVELFTTSNNQESLEGIRLVSIDGSGTTVNTYEFPSNSGTPTSGRTILLATPGFAKLPGEPGGIVPDYKIPFDFLFTGGGTLDFGFGADVLSYTALPTDAINSLDSSGTSVLNSPTNFAGDMGSLEQNSYAIFYTDAASSTLGVFRIPIIDVLDTTSTTTVHSGVLQLSTTPPTSTVAGIFEVVSATDSERSQGRDGFHDHPLYDVNTNFATFPFVAIDDGTNMCLDKNYEVFAQYSIEYLSKINVVITSILTKYFIYSFF